MPCEEPAKGIISFNSFISLLEWAPREWDERREMSMPRRRSPHGP